jgi:hypothetical protein
MRLYCLIVALALSAAFASDSWGQSQQPSPRPSEVSQPKQSQSETSQQQTTEDQRGTEKAPIVVKVLPSEHTPEEAKQYAQDRQDKTTLEWRTLLLTAITAIVLVLQLFVFGWQARRLHQTIETMQGTERRSLRAYVGMDKLGFEVPHENTVNFAIDLDTPGVIHDDFITVKVRNFGATPASDVCVFVYAVTTGPGQRLDETFFPNNDGDRVPTGAVRIWLTRFTLHPNQIEIVKAIFHPHVVRDARAGRANLYFYGRIYYRDIYGRPWRTRFCYVWEPSTAFHGQRFVAYEQYNGEDQIELG